MANHTDGNGAQADAGSPDYQQYRRRHAPAPASTPAPAPTPSPAPAPTPAQVDVSNVQTAIEAIVTKTKYEVGSHALCLPSWDNQSHPVEIIDRRDSNAGVEYYVHYMEQNKRLDEWVLISRLQELKQEGSPNLKSSVVEKLTPLIIPGTPVLTAGETKLDTPGTADRKLTRNFKRRYDEMHNVQKSVDELAPIDQTLEKEHEEKTKVKNIQVVELGKYEIDTWYYSPYPDDYCNNHKLFICGSCLKYMKKRKTYLEHREKCKQHHPPGEEIYSISNLQDEGLLEQLVEDPSTSGQARMARNSVKPSALSIFEVDGKKSKLYCQNLCLLAKLFLDHKTLYYDVEAFLFYILTEADETGYHIAGYFSKEKCSAEDYNLACILTLPPYQRKGYGRLLISLAYELSKREGKFGTPERPLSDLGHISFKSYWTRVLLEALRGPGSNASIKDLSGLTGIKNDDIISTLQSVNLLKYYKGQHIINVSTKVIEEHLKNLACSTNMTINPLRLNWNPPMNNTFKRPR